MSVAVAHSFSAQGRAALIAGAAEARLRNTDLVVFRVVEVPGTDPGKAVGVEIERDVTEIIGASTDQLAWRVVTATSGGDTAAAAIDLVQEAGAEILVLGSRRRSPVGKLLMGSVVQDILIDAPFPVLVVKAEND
ncbi:MAG: universal stress protein [Nocardioidaceae bacterium]|nr:MAG: universal stress protein [Nocardioidaceae bacterium]